MNPIRYVAEQNVADIEEWGPITDAASFRVMYDMDAYRAVLDHPAPPRWPHMLVTTGINDPRAATFHSAKFAAALAAKGADVMLRVDFEAGHGIGSTRDQTDALRADEYGFTLAVANGQLPAG
jgi:prolyl oligopeptidase